MKRTFGKKKELDTQIQGPNIYEAASMTIRILWASEGKIRCDKYNIPQKLDRPIR
jgi:hypothetical protein